MNHSDRILYIGLVFTAICFALDVYGLGHTNTAAVTDPLPVIDPPNKCDLETKEQACSDPAKIQVGAWCPGVQIGLFKVEMLKLETISTKTMEYTWDPFDEEERIPDDTP